MRKRSEIKSKAKGTSTTKSAAERTVPMQYTDEKASVACGICEVVSKVGSCHRRDDNTLECPACGAPIEGVPVVTTGELKTPKKEPEEDIPFPEDKVIGPAKSALTTTLVSEHNPLAENVHEMPPKAYCAKCGSEWAMVNGRPFPNCGHLTTSGEPLAVDDPHKADRYNPPAGSARATVLGRTLKVVRGKHNFPYPGMNFGGFSIGPGEVVVELGPDTNIVDAARQIRADLRKMADEAFAEEMKWYEEKLDQLAKAAKAAGG